jgi:hypothetical protein
MEWWYQPKIKETDRKQRTDLGVLLSKEVVVERFQ